MSGVVLTQCKAEASLSEQNFRLFMVPLFDQSDPDSLLSQGHHCMRVYEAQYQSSDDTEIAIKLRVTCF
jgi:hypothetical protein